jgi:hypothetical protein
MQAGHGSLNHRKPSQIVRRGDTKSGPMERQDIAIVGLPRSDEDVGRNRWHDPVCIRVRTRQVAPLATYRRTRGLQPQRTSDEH